MNTIRLYTPLALTAALSVLVVGCSGSSRSSQPPPAQQASGAATTTATGGSAPIATNVSTAQPLPSGVQEANMVIALEVESHPNVAAAFIEVESVTLRDSATGATETIPVGTQLPVDLAELNGDNTLMTVARVPDGNYDTATLTVSQMTVIDNNGFLAPVAMPTAGPNTIPVTLNNGAANTQNHCATVAVNLNLDRDLIVNSLNQTATWTPALDADTFSNTAGAPDVPLRLAGGVVIDTDPATASARVAVDEPSQVVINIQVTQGMIAETPQGRVPVIDPSDFVRTQLQPGLPVEFDGAFQSSSFDVVPSELIVNGGTSQMVRTDWDPIMRGVVTAVLADRFEMLVITSVGPGSPPAFSKVMVTPLGGEWNLIQRGSTEAPALVEGAAVLANTLPKEDGTFEADRVELRDVAVFVQPAATADSPDAHTVLTVSGVSADLINETQQTLTISRAAGQTGPAIVHCAPGPDGLSIRQVLTAVGESALVVPALPPGGRALPGVVDDCD